MVAAAPLYNPNMPLVRINSSVRDVADIFGTVLPSVNAKLFNNSLENFKCKQSKHTQRKMKEKH